MRAIRRYSTKSAIALALSMSALPNLVNGQPQSLSSVNKHKSSNKSELKDSVKDEKAGMAKLVEIMLANGSDATITNNLAPVIGLPKSMPAKRQELVISDNANGVEKRACYVIYEKVHSTEPKSQEMRPVCAYVIKSKRSGLDSQTRYFRVDLNGKLEKVVLSQGKFDTAGQPIRGSGVKFDQDIDSPEVKKTFEAEMKFWLKDWLKKEKKAAAKTSASAVGPNPAATSL